MKICHIITRLIVGGAQENTILSCAGLANRGHDVTLISGPETGPEGSLWTEADRSGATVIRLDSLRRNVHPYYDLCALDRLTKVLSVGAFDVVHTHSSKAGILGRLAAARAGAPVVVHTIHGMSFNRTQPPVVRGLYRRMERWVAPKTHAFVAVADSMVEQAVAAGLGPRERFTTIRSGVRTEQYVPDASRRAAIRARWGVADDEVVVGTVARLFRNKGYEELIEAMSAAFRCVPSLRFVWVGDGANRDEYLARLEAVGLRDRVYLTGLVPPADIPGLVESFDIVVHASRWEGLPRVLVQGLLMEVPGVSFDNDGAPEVITDGRTGVLVRFGDTAGLADGIVRLAKSPELRRRMGVEGRRRCLETFNSDRMVDALERLYTRLLAKRR